MKPPVSSVLKNSGWRLCSSNPCAAGDFEGVAGDVGSEGRGHQQDAAGGFFRRGGAAQRGHHLFQELDYASGVVRLS